MAERIAAYQTTVKWSLLTTPPSTYGNATTLSVGEWNLNINTDLIDVTTTGDAGFRYFIPGLKSSEGSLTFYHEDATDLPIKPKKASLNCLSILRQTSPSLISCRSQSVRLKSLRLSMARWKQP
jgi:hypothetical protein